MEITAEVTEAGAEANEVEHISEAVLAEAKSIADAVEHDADELTIEEEVFSEKNHD